ncbi:anaphase-promoting complex subunit 5 isoform X2 [Cryptomeria japonica]|uniref:anaphase-promoting complex subunit 5 isoform X2 n=1 Tax=Cryptomeria japonica TaxID=3369 RepID=UPI0027DA66F8|nr:anaphase-promoting complex subunit 5 isoform X2 [Cryptomeria japonica]
MAGSSNGYAVTPHKISLSILLQLCVPCFYSSDADDGEAVAATAEGLNSHQRRRLSYLLITLFTPFDNFLEPSLEELIWQLKEAQQDIGEDLVAHLIPHLKKLTSPDDLVNLFAGLRDLLSRAVNEDNEIVNSEGNDKKLNPHSVLGKFLRRCILSFNLLSFEETCHLLTNLKAYYRQFIKSASKEPMYFKTPLTKSVQEDNRDVFDDENFGYYNSFSGPQQHGDGMGRRERGSHHLDVSDPFAQLVGGESKDFQDSDWSQLSPLESGQDLEFTCPTRCDNNQNLLFLRSYGQVEGYLREQADLIDKHVALFPMNAFEAKLNQLEKLSPDLQRVNYLRYLNSLYHGDYPAALQSLHRYFDYSAGKEGFDDSGPFPTGRFQAVLLSLGTMHSRFGHPMHALMALTEAIQEAQQTSDNSCLAHILAAIGYLFSEVGFSSNSRNFDSGIPPGVDIETGSSLAVQQQLPILLKRCLNRASDLKLIHLVIFSRLALAKFDLKHVQRSPISFGLKVSTKLRTYPVDVCKDLRLSCYAFSESGIDPMSLITGGTLSNLSVKNTGSSLIMGDISKIRGPISRSILQLVGNSFLLRSTSWEMYGSGPLVRLNALVHAMCYADSASADDLCLAYVKLIQHLAMFKGYKEAFAALDLAEKRFSMVIKSRIHLLKLQLIHDRALHRGELKLAYLVCNQLGALASPLSGVDMDLKVEASLRHARTLLAAEQFNEATSVAHSLFCMCYKFNMQVESTSALLLLAEIYKKSGNAISGLPYVLASLSICQSFNLDLLQATALLTLAELWLNLGVGHAKHALAFLYQSLPIILGHGGLELRARANLAITKCHLAVPDFSVSAEPDAVLNPLRQAAKEFEVLECHELAGEAFYLIAVIFNSLGNLKERDISAALFQKHVELQNSARKQDPVIFAH